ncbi:repressor of yield of denv protein homolog [Plakobranchus ocellatus]|uniref:Repressor of yield of denv protein homolog n=1 Tax=Plakobranchus ocellatus TaxID=259542 RepID=A0AAV4DD67_9GAST|nr:repressor of yield of denv protein homolog [Plakobranchus ocellatus]
MRNRFSQEVSLKLINDFGGEREALDFLLNENESDVHKYLHSAPEYVRSLRIDSQNLASILENGFESSVRMFGCGSCVRTWWKRVPVRKEVSRCHRCKVKYDPIPKDKEWGWGKFECPCGNEFTGYAIMGLTESICFKCNTSCPVKNILPPKRRTKSKKSRAPHTCNGVNCYNRDADDMAHNHMEPVGYTSDTWTTSEQANYTSNLANMSTGAAHTFSRSGSQTSLTSDLGSEYSAPAGAYPGPRPEPICIHPKSQKPKRNKLRYESIRHHSTGSTVSDVLSQGSVYTETVISNFSRLDAIREQD